MKCLGIEFAPLFVPFHRRLELLSAATLFLFIMFGPVCSFSLTYYLLFHTRFWPLTLIYLLWIVSDWEICNKGGRSSTWFRSSKFWHHVMNYFPVSYKEVAGLSLDQNKNYLACTFPHGIYPFGSFLNIGSTRSEFAKAHPEFQVYFTTLSSILHFPFYRELFILFGAIAVSKKSILHVLNQPGGGKYVGIVPGGASEAFDAKPGQHKLMLKHRKGFIKIALLTGATLLPVYTFGENNVFKQVENSTLKKLQDILYRLTGVAMVIVKGRGFFQYTFGFIPHREKITVLAGLPIDVEKTENPTQEQIDDLHEKFINELTKLFEENKKYYIKNSENVHIQF